MGFPSLPAYTFIGQETIFHYSIHPSITIHHPPSFFALLLCTYCYYYYYHLVNLVSSSTVPLLSQFRVYSSDQLPDNFPQLFLSQLHQQNSHSPAHPVHVLCPLRFHTYIHTVHTVVSVPSSSITIIVVSAAKTLHLAYGIRISWFVQHKHLERDSSIGSMIGNQSFFFFF